MSCSTSTIALMPARFAAAIKVFMIPCLSGVSTSDKHGIMKTLIAAAKRAGIKAIVLVEHDMDLVAAYSRRIIALSEGQVLADLPPDRFFADPHLIETVTGRRKGH